MKLVPRLIHSRSLAQGLFTGIIREQLRRIGLDVSDRFSDRIDRHIEFAGDLFRSHRLFARIPAVKHSCSNARALEKKLFVARLRIGCEMDVSWSGHEMYSNFGGD